MKRLRPLLTGVLLLLTWVAAQAQHSTTSVYLEETLEELSLYGEEADWEDELEQLEQLRLHPLDVNRSTRSDWELLPFLSESDISILLDYRARYGDLLSLNELYAVPGLHRRTIERILPFVTIQPIETKAHFPTPRQWLKWGRHTLEGRVDIPLYRREGYKSDYLGPSLYHSIRYRYRCGQSIVAGFTAEKDAGEPLFALYNNKGYDYYSPYLMVRNLRWINQLIVGNYRLHLGLGLIVGSGFMNGKSATLTTATFRNTTLTPHGSTDEYRYFQGAAMQVSPLKRLQLTAFYSHRSLEGTLKGDTVTSIYKTGLHRTEKEADKRNAFTRQDMGGDLTYRHGLLQIGVTGLYTHFSRPYYHQLPKYARYYPVGSDFHNFSLHYQARWQRFVFSGESALGKKGYALLHRLNYRFHGDGGLLLIHRLYSHDYWTWHGAAFGESGTPQNENGWYLAAEVAPWRRWRLFASLDLFSHPWWKYRISKPSQGLDALTQAEWSPSKRMKLTLNYRFKRKERDLTGSSGQRIEPLYHHRSRLRLTYSTPLWQSQTTADYNHFQQTTLPAMQGYAVTQRLTLTPQRFPLKLSLQGSYFHTDNYDSRVYAYEPGLNHTFSSLSFSGHGLRATLLLRYDHRWLSLLAKWSETRYFDRRSISSGKDLINQRHKDDLYLQAILRW